jgi:hypothetical protein
MSDDHPTLESLAHVEDKPERQTILLSFVGRDDLIYDLEIAATCIPQTVAALHNALEGRRTVAVGRQLIGIAAEMKDDGTPAIGLLLNDGTEMHLEATQQGLVALRGVLDEMIRDESRLH